MPTLLLPNIQPPVTRATSVTDPATSLALRSTEAWATMVARRLSTLTAVTGSGTVNTLPKWSPEDDQLADSHVSDDGTTVTVASALTVTGTLTTASLAGTVQTVTTTGVATVTLNANTTVVRFNCAAELDAIGLTGGYDGRVVFMENAGAGNVLFYDEHGSATAANRIKWYTPGAFGYLVNSGGHALAIYDGTISRWRISWLMNITPPSRVDVVGEVTATGSFTSSLRVWTGGQRINHIYAPYSNLTAATTHNWCPHSGVSPYPTYAFAYVDCSVSTGATTITGFDAGASGDGDIIVLINRTGSAWTLKHQDAGSLAANRFWLFGGVDNFVDDKTAVHLYYMTGVGWVQTTPLRSSGGYPTGSGTAGTHAKWTGTTTLGNSLVSESGSLVTVTGSQTVSTDLTVNGNAAIGSSAVTGSHTIKGAVTYSGNTWTHNGNLLVGSGNTVTIGSATSINQTLTVTSSAATGTQLAYTGTGLAGNAYAVNANQTGTFDTTAAGRTAWGLRVTQTSSRSAGANNLTNIGVETTATGGQVNVALYTIDGSNYLNATSGNTGIGFALGSTLSAKLHVTGDILATTNITATGNLSCNGNATLGDASGDTHTVNGNVTFNNTPTAGWMKYGSLNGRVLIATRVLTRASVSPWTPSTNAKACRVRMVAGGGGGGGAAAGNAAAAGGAGGGYFEKWFDAASNLTGGTFSVGAGGAGGPVAGTAGSPGGDTSIQVNGVTYTAKGGGAGGGMGAAGGTTASAGGAGVAGGSTGDVNFDGQPGANGLYVFGSFTAPGTGGSSPFGGGGGQPGFTASVTGLPGTGYGAGGSGAGSTGVAKVGGAGSDGVIIIEEYA